jgi:citronellol/citronellal dehydrogenase
VPPPHEAGDGQVGDSFGRQDLIVDEQVGGARVGGAGQARSPQIMADAAYAVLTRDAGDSPGEGCVPW